MKAEEFIKTLDEGKSVYRTTAEQLCLIHLTMIRHPSGTYVYMDVLNGVYVTVNEIEKVGEFEILGWAGDVPVLTIKTEAWFA